MIKYAQDAAQWLLLELEARKSRSAAVVFLTDDNTKMLCLPVLENLLGIQTGDCYHISIPAGEASKNLASLSLIWDGLTTAGAGRDTLLICLGGGMITDIGGFAASTYKRGIDVVHIPTTLLGMVDAAIGGKTGIDYQHYKNHLGSFYQPLQVLIFSDFLLTLPERQLRAGFAEVLKYALISGRQIHAMPKTASFDDWMPIIRASADTKSDIVQKDPKEQGLRKVLNFGHTIGHAIESQALEMGYEVLHGEAVAAGLLAELWLSVQLCGLDVGVLNDYAKTYQSIYSILPLDEMKHSAIIDRMHHDKKNAGGQIRFVLLEKPGRPVWDVPVDEQNILGSLKFLSDYNKLMS